MKTLIAVMGCLVAASAFAGLDGVAATDTGSVLVRFADVDLEKSAGATVLYSRLQHAARKVCPGYPVLDLDRRVAWSACYNTAVARAVQSVNRPSLTVVHMSHAGRAATPQLAAN